MDAIVLSQHSLGLISKIFNSVDMIFTFGKRLGMVDALMVEAAHVKRIVGTVRIGVNDAVRLDFAGNDGHQRLGSGVVDHDGVDPSLTFEDAKDSHFSCRPPASLAFTFSTKITFIHLDTTFKHLGAFMLPIIGNHLPDFLVKKRRRI